MSSRGSQTERATVRILYLSWWNPYPPDDGARLRAFSLLRVLSVCCGYDVDLLSFAESATDISASTEHLSQLRIRARFIPHLIQKRTRLQQLYPRLAAAMRGKPYLAWVSDCAAMRRAVVDSLNAGRHDLVIADTSWMAQFVPAQGPYIRKLLHWVNVDSEMYGRRTRSETNPFVKPIRFYNYWIIRRFEQKTVRRFHGIITVTEDDSQLVLRNMADSPPVHCLPLSLDAQHYAFKLPEEIPPHHLLFVGTMSYQPNVEAVQYFYHEIYPLIRENVPTVRLAVVGKDPVESILRLAERDSSVTVTGRVPDVRDYYHQAAVVIAPVRYGGGMKTKIIEAMALGTPVVATAFAMQGISSINGECALISDSPADFAKAVIALLRDSNRRRQMSMTARRLVEDKYSWQALSKGMREIIERHMRESGGES